ncbi:hypothetical protein PRK78_006078 [Emydomyces testavorans]|uniref:DUF7924 domain-containing protein n=1 Tax=Emydomyces testavorans TaxID=2070801 RepID=A0AAF0DNF7_9EURO|nr:hypothetical protein PRK78_006078 [Emydomyces testavorans]
MPCPNSLNPSRKRQKSEERQLGQPQYQSKRLKLSPPPEYWDNLSKIWLTKNALRELDRRNSASRRPGPLPISHRPATRQFQAARKSRCQALAPDPRGNCTSRHLREIKRFSRQGGPDLSDLLNYPNPKVPLCQSMGSSESSSRGRKRRAESPPSSSSEDTRTTTKSASTTAYSRNFQQNLIDHGIYPDGYEYPDGRLPEMPNNWDEINERLARPRPSLSPSQFSESKFRKFKRADTNASKEKPVMSAVIPIIDGEFGDPKCVGGDYTFGNLAPLTDGMLAKPKPDHFFGARPEQLNRQLRHELGNFIIPSTQEDLPMAPNFFLEAKGPDGSLAIATRQACYHGALGARGIHSLQSYKQDELAYDNNAYTVTSTYHGGTLKLYTTHPTAPRESDGRPEYIMTSLRSFAMTDNAESFRNGASAYRNARDWAKEQREKFIKSANERHAQGQLQRLSTPGQEMTSESTVALDDSATSPVSDDTEFSGAQGHPIDSVEKDLPGLGRNHKKPKTQASSNDGAGNASLPH